MQTLTLNDMYEAAKTMSREDKMRLRDMLSEHLSREVRMDFGPGDKVKFNGRHGDVIVGTILRVNRKSVKVAVTRLDGLRPQLWNVSPQLITAA